MSARTDLADELAAALPARFVVKARTATPDKVDPGKLAVRVLPATYSNAPQVRGLLVTLTVWVVTGLQDPDRVDDALDAAVDDILAALLPLSWVQFESAERGVMDDLFHGYRFTLTTYATITTE